VADQILAIQQQYPELHSRKLAQDPTLPEQVRKWRIGKEPTFRGPPPFAAKSFTRKHGALKSAMAAVDQAEREAKVGPEHRLDGLTAEERLDMTVDAADFKARYKARNMARVRKAADAAQAAAEELATYLAGISKQDVLSPIEFEYLRQLSEPDIAKAKSTVDSRP